MGIIEILTIVFIALKSAGVGACANWDVIAWPWHWSCLCLEMWSIIAYGVLILLILTIKIFGGR